MKALLKTACAALVSLAAFGPSMTGASQGHVPVVTEFIESDVLPWLGDPLIVGAIKQQNASHATLSEKDIEILDQQWRAGVEGRGHFATIDIVADNALSKLLQRKLSDSDGRIAEILVMDNKGLIVGSSDVTSDYWQGDEAKFQKSFGAGKGAIFVDGIEKDESTQALQAQASVTISDETGTPIGAITVGVNLDAL